MRKLTDAQNIDVASPDYPKGRTRSKTLSDAGTISSEILLGDIIQFFQKLTIDAGITENDLPDNVTNGYQLVEALLKYTNDGLRTKVIPIGDWGMDLTDSVTINHGLSDYKKIISVGGVIISDDDAVGIVLGSYNISASLSAANMEQNASIGKITNSTIEIQRKTGGRFDTADFKNLSFNRGYITIQYFE